MGILDNATTRLIEEGNLPAFIYFEHIIKANLDYFLYLTRNVPFRKCLYSVKAAGSPFLLRLLHKYGISGFDASSLSEALYVYEIFGKKGILSVTYPAPSKDEISGLSRIKPEYFHLDSLSSLETFLENSNDLPLGIRVNPGIGYSKHILHRAGGKRSRLGIPIDELGEVFHLCKKYGRQELGIHFHISCQSRSSAYHARAVEELSRKIRDYAQGLVLTHLNIGGGFYPPGWNFKKDTLIEPKIDQESIRQMEKEIKKFVLRHKNILKESFSVFFEPGDFLACSAAVLVARVLETRTDYEGKGHLILDTNINHFPCLLQYGDKPKIIFPRAKKEGEKFIIAGNSCLAGDILSSLRLAPLEIPPYIIFGQTGAYGYSELNFFCGKFRPSLYLYDLQGELQQIKSDSQRDLLAYWKEGNADYPEPHQSFDVFEGIARQEKGMSRSHPDTRYISSLGLDRKEFPVPDALVKALSSQFRNFSNMNGKSLGSPQARDRIAQYENLSIGTGGFYGAENTVVTLGEANALWLVLKAFMHNGMKRLLISCPNDNQFTLAARSLHIPWTHIHKDDAKLTANDVLVNYEEIIPSYADIVRAVDENPDVGAVILSDPGLPFGKRMRSSEIRKLARKAKDEDWLLIVDETLGDLDFSKPSGEFKNWKWLKQTLPVIRIKTLSKTFGLSGLGLGYMCITDAVKSAQVDGVKALDRMAREVDVAYASPPSTHTPILFAALDILEGNHKNKKTPGMAELRNNLSKLKKRVAKASDILKSYGIPHILPDAGSSIMIILKKLRPCPADNFDFFKSLLRKHSIFVELGGLFCQNPKWDFTVARLGMGRPEKYFEDDITKFCQFYSEYSPDH